MAIDRIGKNPGAQGLGGVPDPSASPGSRVPGADGGAAPFAVQPVATEGASATGANKVLGPNAPALERLRAGEIDAPAYVEIKVDEATRHLAGLRPADLETIRSELRHRLSADPALADLVKQATGTSVDLPEE